MHLVKACDDAGSSPARIVTRRRRSRVSSVAEQAATSSSTQEVEAHVTAGSTDAVIGRARSKRTKTHPASAGVQATATSMLPTGSSVVRYPAGWCRNQAIAIEQYKGATLWMSQDVYKSKAGHKQYRGFQSLREFLEFAEASKHLDSPSSLYELILDPNNTPVYMYLDADMHLSPNTAFKVDLATDLQAGTETVAKALLNVLEAFLTHAAPIHLNSLFRLEPGVNCQVSEGSRLADTCKPAKISIHMVVYIQLASVAEAKLLASGFRAFIERLPDTDERKPLLMHEPNGVSVPIIDLAPYNKSQNFRMLFSAKSSNKAAMLKPLLASSPCIGAHLVGVYDSAEAEATLDPDGVPYLPPRTLISFPPLSDLQLCTQATPQQASLARIPQDMARRLHQRMSAPEQVLPAWPPGFVSFNTKRDGTYEDGTLEQTLKSLPAILEALKVQELKFSYKRLLAPHICSLTVDKANPTCPYAHRVHKSNNVCLLFNYNHRMITIKCMDHGCSDELEHSPKLFQYNPGSEDAATADSLHDYEKKVTWAESYESEVMRPYPTDKDSVVCIAARMALGKTKQMMGTIMGPLKEKSVLLLTHRRSLARKYLTGLDDLRARPAQQAEFEAEGPELPRFTCYLDTQGEIDTTHTIVCVNSACRVRWRAFGAVFIDEAVGVLSQLASKTLPDNGIVITHIMNLLVAADRVYFLDAFADTTLVYEFASLVRALKGIPSVTWIRNQHIVKRHGSERKTTIITLDPSSDRQAAQDFDAAFLNHVITSLKAGRRVYVPCTTKSKAEHVQYAVQASCPDINFQVYTSITDNEVKDDAIANVNTAWEGLDLVISSNSLESGISYEGARFTEVIAWAQNCLGHGAPVFSILQQLFRVRNLGPEGRMAVYVSQARLGPEAIKPYPCTSEGVDAMLESGEAELISNMPQPLLQGARYTVQQPRVQARARDSNAGSSSRRSRGLSRQQQQQLTSNPGHVKTLPDFWEGSQEKEPLLAPLLALQYDRTSPSYVILRGSLVMRHKSNVRWTQIITSTLRDEYGLPVTVKPFSVQGLDLTEALELSKAARTEAADQARVAFSTDLLLRAQAYDRLIDKQREGTVLSLTERQQVYTTFIFRRLWCIDDDSKFDQGFFDQYVRQHSKAADQALAKRRFYALRRSVDALNSTTEQMHAARREVLLRKVARATTTGAEPNRCCDIFNQSVEGLYQPAIEAARLLDCMVPEWRSEVRRGDFKFTLTPEALQGGAHKWAEGITPAQYKLLREHCGIGKFEDPDKWRAKAGHTSQFVTLFLQKALGVEMGAVNKSRNQRSPVYGHRVVQFSELQEVLSKYEPRSLTWKEGYLLAEYAFLEDS